MHCIFGSNSKSANSSFQGCRNRWGKGAIDPNIHSDQLNLFMEVSIELYRDLHSLLRIVSQKGPEGGADAHHITTCPPNHIFGPSYGPVPSFMYAAKNKNYFSEKKETVVVSLVRDSVIQSVILILACFYKTHGDRMSCEELVICSISCIYPSCQTKS